MRTNWTKKNDREDLISFLYEQNQQIMKERDQLLIDSFIIQANRGLQCAELKEVENKIAELVEYANALKKAIEEADEELNVNNEKGIAFEKEVYNYYQQLQEEEL